MATLTHLADQQVSSEISWEIIVVDNASTDGTADVALHHWPKGAPIGLKVVNEPRLGLSHARERGFLEAKYEIVSFIDDDNWVCPNWIVLVSEIMTQHPEIAACGGPTDAVCETNAPWWFETYKASYAIGPQAEEAGDISHKKGRLRGAGLNVRKLAWQQLVDEDFRPLLVDRQGDTLSCGGDSELCYALRLAGWGLWYDPRLRMRHFLPANRFDWSYLRKVYRGDGAASVISDLYRYALQGEAKTSTEALKRSWQWKILAAFVKLLLYGCKTVLSFYSGPEGNPHILQVESQIGRLRELVRSRRVYNSRITKSRHNRSSGTQICTSGGG